MSNSALFFDLHSGQLSVMTMVVGCDERQAPEGLLSLHVMLQQVLHRMKSKAEDTNTAN